MSTRKPGDPISTSPVVEHIRIRFQEDHLFGPDPEATEGVDVPASIDRYITTLTAELQRKYPEAEIDVAEGLGGPLEVRGPHPEPPETPWIEQLIHDHWEAWEWVVEAE